jgi:valyl-tRNA synthetase
MQETTITKQYDPKQVETKWYTAWKNAGCFHSEPDHRTPYTIVIPPPNVTGVLHMGHMLNNTIQDVLIRRKRMQGFNACWVPGTDHASIATEAKVVAMLREQGISKSSLTRAQFLDYAWQWKEKYGEIILKQLEKLGCSCDWQRTRFTMEPALSDAVIHVFCDLYQKGYIYRGLRMVNWDPVGKTTVSDEEVVHIETPGKLYYIKYPIVEIENEYITFATTRPETLLADVAVAVHPDDDRYRHLVGKKACVHFTDRRIPIIADNYIDPTFGTGCLKVTPGHDINDYEIGLRHRLPIIDCLNPDGTLNELGGIYAGKDRFEVRQQITADLERLGFLIKTENITHSIGHSERTRAVIEPRLSQQWFVKMTELAKPALEAVLNPDNEGVRLVPAKFVNTYRHWIENIKDWCISRQLWWGHQIPAYYLPPASVSLPPDFITHDAAGRTLRPFVVAQSREAAFELAKKQFAYTGSIDQLEQDPDVLDTWFSSWLWPLTVFDHFSSNQRDINYYYPTDDLVTAPEILFLWVARMIMAGYEYRKQRPFKHVYLTGIVRDKEGRKMSKSLGNSPDALELIEKYSADGVRVGMLLCSPAGNDLKFDEALCEQGRNFANKIWNAFRLLSSWQMRIGEFSAGGQEIYAIGSRWMKSRIDLTITELDEQFSQFRISEALMTLYKLIWDDWCATYLECIKAAIGNDGLPAAAYAESVRLFESLLKLLHPMMPFVTEEIWQSLAERKPTEFLMLQPIPTADDTVKNLHPEAPVFIEMAKAQAVIAAIRHFRATNQLSPKTTLSVSVLQKKEQQAFIEQYHTLIEKLANLTPLRLVTARPPNTTAVAVGSLELFIMFEISSEETAMRRKKILEDIAYTEGFRDSVLQKLNNEKFVSNAKAEIVARERKKLADAEANLEALRQSLAALTEDGAELQFSDVNLGQ